MKATLLSSLFVLCAVLAPMFAHGADPIPTDEEIMARQNGAALVTVNGVDIPKWMFDNAFRDAVASAKKKAPGEPVDETAKKKVILHNLVEMEVLYQEAKRKGMAVNLAGGALRGQIIAGRHKNKDDFKRALAAAGMTEKQYAEIWRQQASVNQMVEGTLLNNIEVSQDELAARYEKDKGKYARQPKIRASHILATVDKDASEEERAAAKSKVQTLRERLLKGEDFAELAKETGGFPSAPRGGDLGWFASNRMVPAFSEVAFALKTGEISDVVETQFGYHVIMKTGEQDPIPSMEEIGKQLANVIRMEKGRNAFIALRDGLLQQAEVEFHDAELEAVYAER